MRTLRLLLDVALLQSISRAAAAHGITQSAVSQRIRQLEADLSVTLFDRSVRPLALTPAGEVFVDEARELVDRYEKLWEKVGKLHADRLEGEVRVGAIYSAGIDLMQTLRDGFEAQHPGVRIVVDYKRPEEVDAAVRQGRCHVGIVSYPKRWPGLTVRQLRDERMLVACPPNHPLLNRKSVHAAELGDYPLVGFGSGLPAGRHLRRYLRRCGVSPSFTYEPDNIDTIKSMLAVGDQIAILPRRTVAREVAAGTLGAVELEPELHRPMGIIHLRKPRLSPAARAFVQYLLEHADPDAVPIARQQVKIAS